MRVYKYNMRATMVLAHPGNVNPEVGPALASNSGRGATILTVRPGRTLRPTKSGQKQASAAAALAKHKAAAYPNLSAASKKARNNISCGLRSDYNARVKYSVRRPPIARSATCDIDKLRPERRSAQHLQGHTRRVRMLDRVP